MTTATASRAYAADPRREILINGEAYRRAMYSRPAPRGRQPHTNLTHAIVSGVAMALFVVAFVVWVAL